MLVIGQTVTQISKTFTFVINKIQKVVTINCLNCTKSVYTECLEEDERQAFPKNTFLGQHGKASPQFNTITHFIAPTKLDWSKVGGLLTFQVQRRSTRL